METLTDMDLRVRPWIRGLECLHCEDSLGELGLVSLKRLQLELMAAFLY